MSVIQTFAVGAAFGLLISLATVLALRPRLGQLLNEVCGSRARAGFWMATSSLCIFLLGILAATVSFGYPDSENPTAQQLFFGLITQVRACLIGLLVSLLVVTWLLLSMLPRFEQRRATPAPSEPAPTHIPPTIA